MSAELRLLALGEVLAVPAGKAGDVDTAGAPLVGPAEYGTGDGAATLARQRASGYFGGADAPVVAPTMPGAADAAQTLAKQRASGCFPEAGAPRIGPTITAIGARAAPGAARFSSTTHGNYFDATGSPGPRSR